MPIQIGAKPESGFNDPLGLLSDCHRRIERFLAQIVRIVEAHRAAAESPSALTADSSAALEAALQYFRTSGPLHTRDEEESLFPRLRLSESAAAHDALKTVDALEVDHDVAESAHTTLDQIATRWLTENTLPPDDATRLHDLTLTLQTLYARHIAAEDTNVFPLAAQALSPTDLHKIGQEMAARRGVPFEAPAPLTRRSPR